MTGQTCPKCGLTEAAGAYCTRCETPTGPGAWKQGVEAPVEAPGASPSSFQRCQRCGTDEAAGAYCTWCRTGEYDLVEHAHTSGGRRGSCPLGPYLNPSGQSVYGVGWKGHVRQFERDRAAWDASHDPAEAEPFITRRWTHPAANGAQRQHATAA
jgi:hypothetical protein